MRIFLYPPFVIFFLSFVFLHRVSWSLRAPTLSGRGDTRLFSFHRSTLSSARSNIETVVLRFSVTEITRHRPEIRGIWPSNVAGPRIEVTVLAVAPTKLTSLPRMRVRVVQCTCVFADDRTRYKRFAVYSHLSKLHRIRIFLYKPLNNIYEKFGSNKKNRPLAFFSQNVGIDIWVEELCSECMINIYETGAANVF